MTFYDYKCYLVMKGIYKIVVYVCFLLDLFFLNIKLYHYVHSIILAACLCLTPE